MPAIGLTLTSNIHRRHSNLGHRAMEQVVFLSRPESWGAFWAVITHNIGLPRSGTGLILARNGALENARN